MIQDRKANSKRQENDGGMRKIHVMQIVIILLLSTLYTHAEKTLELRLSNPLKIGARSTFSSPLEIGDSPLFFVGDKDTARF